MAISMVLGVAMWVVGSFVLVVGVTRVFAADFYDALICKMTAVWYRTVFELLPDKSRVLDIGIGTATALARNSQIVLEKDMTVFGVDYDHDYIVKANKVIKTSNLESNVAVACMSVYDETLSKASGAGEELFDAIYFSGSFTLLPNPEQALISTAKLLKKNGTSRIYITQTFQNPKFEGSLGGLVIAQLKPVLKYLIRIDFGQVTFGKQLRHCVKGANMELESYDYIKDSVKNNMQTARLIVINPHHPAGSNLDADAKDW